MLHSKVREQRLKAAEFLDFNDEWRDAVFNLHLANRATIAGQCIAGNCVFSKVVHGLIVRVIGKQVGAPDSTFVGNQLSSETRRAD